MKTVQYKYTTIGDMVIQQSSLGHLKIDEFANDCPFPLEEIVIFPAISCIRGRECKVERIQHDWIQLKIDPVSTCKSSIVP